jgi:hypothetical protein
MALSIVYLQRTSGVPDYIIRSAQAADPEEMERVVAAHLADIVAINSLIDDPQAKFTPVDANLAGAGDGHTFIFTVTLTRVALAGVQNTLLGESSLPVPLDPAGRFIDPADFVTKFAIASEQDAVDVAINEAVRRLLDQAAGTPGGDALVSTNFIAVAGGAKGQVFMAGVTGVIPPPQIG